MTEDCKGHWHWVDVMTGREVPMPNGNHTHYIAGHTSNNDGHCHDFSAVINSGPEILGEREKELTPQSKPCKYKYNPSDDEEYS